ncbi:DUF262 domain-containing protein [Croceibacter atlanticus]|uniref:DUF262 domain-containing protein n=1 Tax=Croceibacter atlanticus TaxID=313588 RepID=UPI0030D83961|tara:strand:+ start:38113 stop:39948 length:1836 start_codon:yes stop_codon:yes gene_type:complete
MIKNHTKTDNWSVENLVNSITDNSNKNKILIPKFQRTLVWRPNQKKEFVDSIKNGFPIGALLLYKTKTESDITYYTLIDGLQRSTTLKQYSEAPTSDLFFDDTNIETSIIKDLKNLIDNTFEIEELTECIVKWITSLKGFEESKGFSSFSLSDHLNETLGLDKDLSGIKEMTQKLVPYLEKIKDDSNISSFSIPILIYSGPEENLPTIFERLNSRGTQLSKYQIYAAAWQHYELFTISNTEIIDKIKKKYELLIEEGYEVENYDGSKKFYTTKFSKFEYLFGLGKLLADKYVYLFSGNSKSEQEDSIGFNITNICLGKPFSEMNLLPKFLAEYKLEDFEKCIFNSIEFVNDCLKGQIALKMNTTKRISIVHTEMQIVSMIGKAFHSRYDDNLKEKDNWKDSKTKLKKNLKFHYLFDILKESWKGSGDTRAYNLIISDRYENEISKKQWENLFEEWLENDLLKKEKTRVNIKDSSILFYKYLYTHTLSAYEELSDKSFDIEHLVPVGRLKALATDNGLPISAFPNLCLLDSNLNRKKGDETYYEHYDKLIEKEEKTEEQAKIELENIEGYSFTDENDLEFVKTDFTSENYVTFLKNRFKVVTEKFYEHYEIK